MDDAFGPYERLGFFVMAREEGLGNGNEFAHASKPSPFEWFPGQDRDHISSVHAGVRTHPISDTEVTFKSNILQNRKPSMGHRLALPISLLLA